MTASDESLYRSNLPSWRYRCRTALIYVLEWEMPILTSLQDTLSHPILDVAFHFTSFFGTVSSFLIFLPMFYWFGAPELGTTAIISMATGVWSSSFLKDCFCVPRPYSPPVARATLVSSHAREYGFPSTHTTNAVGLALLFGSQSSNNGKLLWTLYATLVAAGRIYSGMHSVTDCLGGLGLALFQHYYIIPLIPPVLAACARGASYIPLTLIISSLALISFHPQPVDPCPCFEDAVAFISVVVGILIGLWATAYLQLQWTGHIQTPAELGLAGTILFTVLKIVLGVLVLVSWRAAVKQVMHVLLPPIIKATTPYLILPRRHYEPSSSYEESYSKLPATPLRNVPSALHLPDLLDETSPTRKRSGSLIKTLSIPHTTNDALDTQVAQNEDEQPNAVPEQKYDADVLTKFVVYSGIGLLATQLLPMSYVWLGWSSVA